MKSFPKLRDTIWRQPHLEIWVQELPSPPSLHRAPQCRETTSKPSRPLLNRVETGENSRHQTKLKECYSNEFTFRDMSQHMEIMEQMRFRDRDPGTRIRAVSSLRCTILRHDRCRGNSGHGLLYETSIICVTKRRL